jgi:hypothetical protein
VGLAPQHITDGSSGGEGQSPTRKPYSTPTQSTGEDMSFLTVLKGFGGWFARTWQKVVGEAPAIEKVADAVLGYSVPAIQIILGVLAPEEAPIVVPILTEVQKDLHIASGLIFDFGATPTASSMISAIEKDLTDLLSAGHIKDTALVAKIQLIVNTIGSLGTALTAALTPAQ